MSLSNKRKKVLFAVVGSLLIHVCILMLCSVLLTYWPSQSLKQINQSETAQNEPLKVTMIPPDQPNVESTPPPYIPTLDRQKTDEANKDQSTAFQSDKNTKAASESSSTNPQDLDMPSQDGVEVPAFAFDTQDHTVGNKPVDNAGQGTPTQGNPNQPPQNPKRPTPIAKDLPKPEPDREAVKPPSPMPSQINPVKATDQEFATLSPDSTQNKENKETFPSKTTPPQPTPVPNIAEQQPPTPNPQAAPSTNRPGAPGYKPLGIKSRISGGVSSRGPSAVSARETPLGRYQKALSDAIGSRWYYYAEQRAGLIPISNVRINFSVTATGKVKNVKVVQGDSNGSLATMSIEALIDAKIPPIPADVAALLQANQIDVTFNFSQL